MRELSIFVDESGDFGPVQKHSPFYVLGVIFHDQARDIAGNLDKIHDALAVRGLRADHAIHTGPLIRREQDYRWLDIAERRSIFRVLVDFVRTCDVSQHSWVLDKRVLDADQLVSAMSRALGSLISSHHPYFSSWDRVVIYYDNGQRELTNVVNSVFNALLPNVEVRKVTPSSYSLFQGADLCCTLALLRRKMEVTGLSASERDFFSTRSSSAERALKKGYLKTMDRMKFGA